MTIAPSALKTFGSLANRETRELICELSRHFYSLGWATGTGGGISIRADGKIFMAPSGVQKEKLQPEDIFILDDTGEILESPNNSRLVVSACRPLFLHAYNIRNAGAVLHSHSMNAMMVTLLSGKTFRISGIEMMKGINGTGVFDTLEVPIIENTAAECDLADSLKEAILEYPKSYAVLVRGHGVYVWGKDWVQAKTHTESYDYLFHAAIKMKQIGIDPNSRGGINESILARQWRSNIRTGIKSSRS